MNMSLTYFFTKQVNGVDFHYFKAVMFPTSFPSNILIALLRRLSSIDIGHFFNVATTAPERIGIGEEFLDVAGGYWVSPGVLLRYYAIDWPVVNSSFLGNEEDAFLEWLGLTPYVVYVDSAENPASFPDFGAPLALTDYQSTGRGLYVPSVWSARTIACLDGWTGVGMDYANINPGLMGVFDLMTFTPQTVPPLSGDYVSDYHITDERVYERFLWDLSFLGTVGGDYSNMRDYWYRLSYEGACPMSFLDIAETNPLNVDMPYGLVHYHDNADRVVLVSGISPGVADPCVLWVKPDSESTEGDILSDVENSVDGVVMDFINFLDEPDRKDKRGVVMGSAGFVGVSRTSRNNALLIDGKPLALSSSAEMRFK